MEEIKTLTEILEDIAAAIRSKTEKEDTINAQNFGVELFSISDAYFAQSMVDFDGEGLAKIRHLDIDGENVYAVRNEAFANMYELTDVEIGSRVTTIETNAFTYCTGLTSVTIPANVISISGGAFSGCSGITSFVVDGNNSMYYSEGNAIIKREGKALVQGCKETIIPDDIEAIENLAFQAIPITSAVIPNTVTSMGNNAFASSGVTYVQLSSSLKVIPQNAFFNCGKLAEIIIPEGVEIIDKNSFYLCGSLTEVKIPSSVTEIKDGAFGSCKNLYLLDLTSLDTPPTLSNVNAFDKTSDNLVIVVKDSSYDNYVNENLSTSTNWIYLANKIKRQYDYNS